MKPSGSLAQIKHRSASCSPHDTWEYDPSRRAILVTLRVGGEESVDLTIPICTHAKPVADRWIVIRRGEDHWTLSATLWPRDMQAIAHAVAFDKRLPAGGLEILCAPPGVQEELASLA